MDQSKGAAQDTDRKVLIKVPEDLLASLRTTCAEKASVSLLGRIQGKNPGLKALTAWARETLHPTMLLLSLKSTNLFEVTFSSTEGRTHALTQTDLTCEAANISFSSWRPHFDAKTQLANDQLDYPVWLQVVGLCQIMREESFLRTIGEHIGQVIAVDNSELYRAKLFGPRIRLLVKDLNDLPQTIIVPRLDREGEVEYSLEYSGLPSQCGRCRSRDHPVRHCPKREVKFYRKAPSRNTQPAPSSQPTAPVKSTEENNRNTQPAPSSQPVAPEKSTEEPTPPIEAGIESHESPETTILEQAANEDPPQLTPDNTNLTQEGTDTQDQRGEREDTPDSIPQAKDIDPPPELQPNEENFPRLSSPSPSHKSPPPSPCTQQPSTPQVFVWRQKPATTPSTTDKGKEKVHAESTPITRQGYRSGRLADDFWSVLNIPGTPPSQKKKLRVLPFLTKNFNHTEYLVDNSKQLHNTITSVNIAELLAGVPWSIQRARQHIVNETAQALHKVLIFNNQHNTPFQKWDQGLWFSQWETTQEDDHVCTLFVSIAAPETKIRIRKGRNIGWRTIPSSIQPLLISTKTDLIQDVAELGEQWQEMAGGRSCRPGSQQPATTTTRNPFSILSKETEHSA